MGKGFAVDRIPPEQFPTVLIFATGSGGWVEFGMGMSGKVGSAAHWPPTVAAAAATVPPPPPAPPLSLPRTSCCCLPPLTIAFCYSSCRRS